MVGQWPDDNWLLPDDGDDISAVAPLPPDFEGRGVEDGKAPITQADGNELAVGADVDWPRRPDVYFAYHFLFCTNNNSLYELHFDQV